MQSRPLPVAREAQERGPAITLPSPRAIEALVNGTSPTRVGRHPVSNRPRLADALGSHHETSFRAALLRDNAVTPGLS